MIFLNDLIVHLNEVLTPEKIQDYAPNGLQVQGKSEIKKIIAGVSACQNLIDIAVQEKADAILVHHGFFWKEENPCITGIKHDRLLKLLENNISLIAYHLPLDIHHTFGNNVQLAKVLNIKLDHELSEVVCADPLVFAGHLHQKMSAEEFGNFIAEKLQRKPLHIACDRKEIKTVALCTGGAQNFLYQLDPYKIDAYITGEISEHNVYAAREMNVHFYSAGHYATERFGVKSLGEYLQKEFSVECQFVELDNPV